MGIKLFLDQIWQNVKVGLNDVNDSFGNRPPPGGEKLTNFLQKLVLPNGTLLFLINFRVMLQAVTLNAILLLCLLYLSGRGPEALHYVIFVITQ